MKIPAFKKLTVSLAAAALFSSPATGATASSGALGYYTFEVPSGNSLWVAGLVAKSNFTGPMLGLILPGEAGSDPTDTILTQTGAGWTVNEFSNHYIELREGSMEGLVLDIISNTADSLLIKGDLTSLGLLETERYTIREHATINSLLPGGGGLTPFLDTVKLFLDDGSELLLIYDNFGDSWLNNSTGLPTDPIIYPGQGFLITAIGAKNVTIGGGKISTVKTGPTKVPLYPNQVNLTGLINPLVASVPGAVSVSPEEEHTMLELGVGSSGLAEFTDNISRFSLDGNLTRTGFYLIDFSGNVVDAGTAADKNGDLVRNGAAIMIIPITGVEFYTAPQLHP